MKRTIALFALVLVASLSALAQTWQPVTTQITVVQEGTQQLHAFVQSTVPVNGQTLKWDQFLSPDLTTRWTAGDTAYVASAENAAANAVWAQQAQQAAPTAPVTLATVTVDPTTAASTVSTFQQNQQTINGFCSTDLVKQVNEKLPQATLLQLLGQIQTLLQNALPH